MDEVSDRLSDVEIAETLGIKLHSTKALIRKHISQLLVFGDVLVSKGRVSSLGGRLTKTYLLNEMQQHFIFSLARPLNRNGEEVAKANKVIEISKISSAVKRPVTGDEND